MELTFHINVTPCNGGVRIYTSTRHFCLPVSRIRTTENFEGALESWEGYWRSMEHLGALTISFSDLGIHEKLEPPPSLKCLHLSFYRKATLPSRWWGTRKFDNWASYLPNLVHVELSFCLNLLHLPSLSELLHLKSLSLDCLNELEYMEDSTHNGSYKPVFFPSLKRLEISALLELKGWWRGKDIDCTNCSQPCFSPLSELFIDNCSNLILSPDCIILEKLSLNAVTKELWTSSLGKENNLIKLREAKLSDLDYLKSLTTEGLVSICLILNQEIENLSDLGETFKDCPSLRSRTIKDCYKLTSLEGAGWEHLTALETLRLDSLHNLTFSETDDDWMLWRCLGERLRTLQLAELGMKTLPNGMRYLTSLENLELEWCWALETLPEWISCLSSLRSLCINQCRKLELNPGILRDLTSLQYLEAKDCPHIAKSFQGPNVKDWAEVQHIPSIDCLCNFAIM